VQSWINNKNEWNDSIPNSNIPNKTPTEAWIREIPYPVFPTFFVISVAKIKSNNPFTDNMWSVNSSLILEFSDFYSSSSSNEAMAYLFQHNLATFLRFLL
jgi:hypothetical protein